MASPPSWPCRNSKNRTAKPGDACRRHSGVPSMRRDVDARGRVAARGLAGERARMKKQLRAVRPLPAPAPVLREAGPNFRAGLPPSSRGAMPPRSPEENVMFRDRPTGCHSTPADEPSKRAASARGRAGQGLALLALAAPFAMGCLVPPGPRGAYYAPPPPVIVAPPPPPPPRPVVVAPPPPPPPPRPVVVAPPPPPPPRRASPPPPPRRAAPPPPRRAAPPPQPRRAAPPPKKAAPPPRKKASPPPRQVSDTPPPVRR